MKEKTDIRQVIGEKDPKKREEKYNQYVKENTPKTSWFLNLCKAFVVGGLICLLGQALQDCYMNIGFDQETAPLYTSGSLILLSVFLTGFNLYPKMAQFSGAGTLVPITGFANSVASAAIEFKKEGQVFGIGAQIFTIAGPVILYGIFSSWLLGLIYWFGKMLGWV